MRIRLIWMLLFCALLGFTLNSCGQKTPASSLENSTSQADEIFKQPCACGDLACWRDTTDKKAVAQRKCAELAVGSIVPIAGPIWSLVKAAWEIHNVGEFVRDLTNLKAAGASVRQNMGSYNPCVGGILDSAADLSTPAANLERAIQDFKASGDTTRLSSLSTIQVSNFSKGLATFLKAVATCKVDKGDVKFLEAKKIVEENAKKLFKSFVKPVESLAGDMLAKINVANVIAQCTDTNLRGSITLYYNAKCLAQDFDEINKGREAVSRSVAKAANRLIGNARFYGCSEAVRNSSDQTQCANTCSTESERRFDASEPYHRLAWTKECRTTCAAARTEGTLFTYLDKGVCKDTLRMDQTKRLYRKLQLTDTNNNTYEAFRDEKEKVSGVSGYLQLLLDNFDILDNANGGEVDGLAGQIDFQALSENTSVDPKLREAAQYIGVNFGQYYFKLIDGASVDGSQDGIISKPDLVAFLEEMRDYKHDSEYNPAADN